MTGYLKSKIQKQPHSQTINQLKSGYKDLYYHNNNVQA